MISFKHRNDRLPSALILLSIAVLAGTLGYMLLVPPPSAAGVVAGRERSRRQLEQEIARATARTEEVRKAVKPRLWQGNAEAVTAAVLNQLTEQAARRSLRITAFRPQRSQALEGITELPFSVQISGPYAAVRATMAALDAAGSKLAVRSVQVASSDGETSAVTATLGVSAYIAAADAAPAPPARGTGGTRG